MSANVEAVQTASKITGAIAGVSSVSHSWWMIFPWADAAIIVSFIGGTFFMIERFYSFRIKRMEYLEKTKDKED